MDKLANDIRTQPTINFDSLYNETDAACPLRQYILSIVALAHFKGSKDLEEPELYPRQMLLDLVNYGNKIKKDKHGKCAKPTLKQFYVDENPVGYPLYCLKIPSLHHFSQLLLSERLLHHQLMR